MGFSALESIRQHLAILVEEGRLLKRDNESRGYALPEEDQPTQVRDVPLLGRIPAGGLEEAVEDPEDSIPVALDDLGSEGAEGSFALRVEGESMLNAGILPGDVVVVRRLDDGTGARTGDIVVAMVGDEATVKTLRRSGGSIELWPENRSFKPLTLPASEVQILGVVREVRRFLRPQSRRRNAPWQKRSR